MEKKYLYERENGRSDIDKSSARSAAPTSDTDDFWDISDMVPIRGGRGGEKLDAEKIPVSALEPTMIDIDGDAPTGAAVPRQKDTFKIVSAEPVIEYDGDGAVAHVRIMPWHTRFSFYDPFAERAARFWSKKCQKRDSISFFSYMPQYDQMNGDQFLYYLYWRDRVRHGEYPSADFSYILLYLYEIINLSNKIRPTLGAELIALVWAAYRDMYPYLDKYAGEWLCDYCLIHKVTVPHKALLPIMPEAARVVSIGEMLLPIGTDREEGIVFSCSAYNYKKSKYYSASPSLFDEHMKKGVAAGAEVYFSGDLYSNLPPIRVVRDSFSGAIASYGTKFKVELEYRCALRSQRTKEVSTGIVKLCENNIRAQLGIKSRFSKINIPVDVERAINAYFDAALPTRYQKTKKDAAEDEYMYLYEPEQVGIADISRAAKIEDDAWQTAIELDGDNIETSEDNDEIDLGADDMESSAMLENMYSEAEGDMSQLVSSLSDELRTVLIAAIDGGFKTACAEARIIPSDAERRINEMSYDIIGDAVMSNGEIIEDYRDDIIGAIK